MKLKSMLEQISVMLPAGKQFKYRSPYDIVLKLGKYWNLDDADYVIPKGKPKYCYENATQAVWNNPNTLRYIEGFILCMGLPINHAWVVDQKGRVIEVTLKEKAKEYFGVAFTSKYLSQVLCTTKVFGLIPEMPTEKFNPYRDGYPKGAVSNE